MVDPVGVTIFLIAVFVIVGACVFLFRPDPKIVATSKAETMDEFLEIWKDE